MKTRRYILYSVIYVALIWIFTFVMYNQTFTINFLGMKIELLVATWIVLPIAVFAVLSIFHIAYNSVKVFLKSKIIKNDANLYNSFAKEILLGFESNKEFKSEFFINPSEITKTLSPWLNLGEPNLNNEDLKEAYQILKKVKNGEVCELKKFKFLKTNPLFLQNEKNKIKANYKYAINLFSSKNEIDKSLKEEAYKALINNATYLELSKFDLKYTNKDLTILVNRYAKVQNFELSTSDLFNLINKNELDKNEYINIAKILKAKVGPDKLISIFQKLKNEHNDATEAYLYILYDLQMIDDLREALNSSHDKEFLALKTLMFLRENGRIISADMFYR